MPLPKLDTPKYHLTVPSLQKRVTYRPFLVKEEKVLLMAQESGNRNEMLRAMRDIIGVCFEECVSGVVEPDNLTVFDLEFMFLNLRAKSVGETVDVNLICQSCQKANEVKINLDTIGVIEPETKPDSTVKLTESVGVTLQYPKIRDILMIKLDGDDYDQTIGLIKASIASIYDPKGVYSRTDISDTEMSEFVDSLNHKQISDIAAYIKCCPRVVKTIEYDCGHCGAANSKEVSGAESFFA